MSDPGTGAVHVFAGPSAPPNWCADAPVRLHPPCVWGAISALVSEEDRPTIVLLDGVMFQAPPPSHFELLAALSLGATLIGAASLGALRAVELRASGMVGVGIVYEAVRKGAIVDDAELCVAMSPTDHRAITVPLVRVRAALGGAVAQGMDPTVARHLLARAREVHFMSRSADALRYAVAGEVARDDLDLFHACLHDRRSDVKAADCVSALACATGESPPEWATFPVFVEDDP